MSTRHENLPLPIELVPEALWGKSLASTLPRSEWDKIRRHVYARQDYVCGACGAKDVRLHCHEKWQYNDEEHTQTLTGFVALCAMCNNVTHMGRSQILARQGKLDIDAVYEHCMRVNHLNKAEFRIYKQISFAKWGERTAWKDWKTVIGDYTSFL